MYSSYFIFLLSNCIPATLNFICLTLLSVYIYPNHTYVPTCLLKYTFSYKFVCTPMPPFLLVPIPVYLHPYPYLFIYVSYLMLRTYRYLHAYVSILYYIVPVTSYHLASVPSLFLSNAYTLHTYLYIYTRIYIHIYTYTYIYIHIHIYTYIIDISTYLPTCVRSCVSYLRTCLFI